jgi:hypothetical protein
MTELDNVNTEIKTFEEIIPLINEKYLTLLTCLTEKFKYHDELSGQLENDLNLINEKLIINKYQIINTVTDNFLFCIEQIADYNSDYFIYQKEKVQKKNGKIHKNKLPKLGNKTLLKNVLNELDTKSVNVLFKNIIDVFLLLTNNSDNILSFNDDYIKYVKNNFNENKNFSKMIMVFDNINNILNNQIEENNEEVELSESEDDNKKNNKSKKNKKNKKDKNKSNESNFGLDFMNGLENTKIAQLAKNISQKINMDDFPVLTDPTKLLSSFANPSENGNGIQDLLKFVVGEVEGAFKSNNISENDLVSEAQNIMGQFSNMSVFDPMSILKDGNLDINQFADIFSNIGKK